MVSWIMPWLVLFLVGIFSASQPSPASADSNAAWTGDPGPGVTPLPTTNTAPVKPPIPAKIPAPLTNSLAGLAPPAQAPVAVASLAVADLREYEFQPPEVQKLLTSALALTTLNLSYRYGSSDPRNGGMDCSGTIYYLLTQGGLKDVPRDASGQYRWVWMRSRFQAVVSSNPDTFELTRLKPGDLLFWTGTYKVDRDPPVTHAMIYLGINRHSGHRVMMGASEGRRFDGKPRYGVSVFDFTLPGRKLLFWRIPDRKPEANPESRFIGYGSIPGLANSPLPP